MASACVFSKMHQTIKTPDNANAFFWVSVFCKLLETQRKEQ